MRWADAGHRSCASVFPLCGMHVPAIFQPDPVPHERLGSLIAELFLPGGPIFVRPNIFSPHCFFGPEAVIERIEDRSISTGIVPKTTTMSVHFMGAPERVLRSSRLNRALLRPLEPDQWVAACRREILRRPRVIEDATHRVFSREFGTARCFGWWFSRHRVTRRSSRGHFCFFCGGT